MTDPIILQSGTVTYNCTDSTGYTLTGVELDDTVTLGFVISENALDQADELDDSDFSNWADSSNLSQDTSTKYYGVSTALVSSLGVDTSRLILTNLGLGPLGAVAIYDGVMFKLNSSSGFTDNCWVLWTSDRLGTSIVAGFGVNTAISNTTFSYYNNTTTLWTDTGAVLDTSWHKIAFTSEDLNGTMKFYDNGSLLATTNSANIRAIVARTSQSGKTANIDRIWHSNDIFYSNGNTLVTPIAMPAGVTQWTGFSKTDLVSAVNKGTLAYDFQYSSDGGSTWNETWTTLSNANLQAVSCDGDGKDAIKIRVTFTSSVYMYSPLVNQIVVNFTPTTSQLIGIINS